MATSASAAAPATRGPNPASSSSTRPPRQVTTAILLDPATSEALLLKRSALVNSYRHKWAFVSGSMEAGDASPMARAATEVEEETGLGPRDAQLVRAGRPQRIVDEHGVVRFVVHPFLFRLAEGARNRVKLDWEHEDHKWVDLDAVWEHDTVPDLVRTILRVWVPSEIEHGLDSLVADRTSGAQELLVAALLLLKTCGEPSVVERCRAIAPIDDPQSAFSHAVSMAYLIKTARPSMASAISTVCSSILADLRNRLDTMDAPDLVFSELALLIDRTVEERRSIQDRISSNLADLAQSLGSDKLEIATHSLSSTILRALLHLGSLSLPKLHVSVTESRPLFEGVSLARRLAEAGISSTLMTDASVLQLLKTRPVDLVLIGSDQLIPPSPDRPTGAAVNKVGSAPLALAAAYVRQTQPHRKLDMYVVSSTDKLSDSHPAAELNDASELTAAYKDPLPDAVEIVNDYFEEIQGDLVKGYVTEKGILDAAGLADVWTRLKEAQQVWEM